MNALLGRRFAIVDDMAGVTRDRVSAPVKLNGRWVELVDTGGIGIVDTQALEDHVEAQIRQALEMADVLVFVTDGKEGCTAIDHEIAKALRGFSVPICLAVNKCESSATRTAAMEHGELGFEPIPILARERQGIPFLTDHLADLLPEAVADERNPDDPILKVAIVGRVNVGKSTFLNHLAGGDRVIVSEVPGTTRDSVDLRVEKDGRTLLVTDTAGLKRESSVQGSVDFYAQRRAELAIRRSEACLFVLDCTDEITRGDRKIGKMIEDAVKPVVIVANKWDLAGGEMTMEDYAKYIAKKLPAFHYAPIVFVTAKEGRNVLAAIDTAQALAKQSMNRVGTPAINKALERARTKFQAPVKARRSPKIYYGTQIEVNPPTIMLFVNDPRLFRPGFRRFLENRLREELPFKEIPLCIVYKRRQSMFADGRTGTGRGK